MVGEHYAMVTLNRVKKEGFTASKDEIKASLKLITEKVDTDCYHPFTKQAESLITVCLFFSFALVFHDL